MITSRITDEIKKTLEGFDENKMYNQMLSHYKTLRLIDNDGKWATPELQKISDELLPKDMTEAKTKAFVDEMALIAEKNPYLVHFLEKAQKQKFETLSEKVKNEGKEVFPDVVALSSVLDRLTKAAYNNPKVLEDYVGIFKKTREENNSTKGMGVFHKVKLLSVEGPIKNVFLKAHKTGVVKKNALSFMLPLNIVEATIGDYINGFQGNVKAGLSLASHRPGGKKDDPNTGKGPAGWSADKKAIEIKMDLPKQWADLYQTWNMSFVSQIRDYPYILTKLCIPQLADYEKKPKEYIENRAISLYIYLHHFEFYRMDKTRQNQPVIDWSDKKLTQTWGRANMESAKDYEGLVKETREIAKRKRQFNFTKPSKQNDKLKTEVNSLRDRLLKCSNKSKKEDLVYVN